MMRISKVTMENFRQYKDVSISFDKKSKFDLHLLLAENGIGKTTLLNAINWCLYGDEPHVSIKEQALPIFNLSKLRELNVGENDNVSVKIEIEIDSGTIIFERRWTMRKTEENEVYFLNGGDWKAITCFIGKCAQVYEGDEADKYVNKFVPKRIRKFFFFDGEQMDTYFTTQTGVNVENSIFEIAQIDLLNSMQKNLSTISNELRRTASNSNPNIADINKKYEGKKQAKDELTLKINKCNEQLSISKVELQRCCDELGDEPDIASLEIRRKQINDELEILSRKKTENEDARKALIIKYTVILYSLPRLKKMLSLIQDKEDKKELPPKIDKELLQKMLEQHMCLICNRDLNGEATINIEKLIAQHELTNDAANILGSIRGSLQSKIKEVETYPNEKKRTIEFINEIENSMKKLKEEKQDMDNILNKYTDKDHIKLLHEERKKHEELIEINRRNLYVSEEELKKSDKEFNDLGLELKRELDKDEMHTSLVREKNMAENATRIVDKIIAKIKGGIRNKISTEMNSIFTKLNWKKDTFGDVKLSESYSISLQNIDGFECLGTCSAAERELLALSFTLALHKESGFDAPLVIDTPISRISGVLRKNFAKVLKEISGEKQIILYLTEDEYSLAVRDIFEPNASNKYSVSLIDENYIEVRRL